MTVYCAPFKVVRRSEGFSATIQSFWKSKRFLTDASKCSRNASPFPQKELHKLWGFSAERKEIYFLLQTNSGTAEMGFRKRLRGHPAVPEESVLPSGISRVQRRAQERHPFHSPAGPFPGGFFLCCEHGTDATVQASLFPIQSFSLYLIVLCYSSWEGSNYWLGGNLRVTGALC